jgi:hypothetical protein
MTPALHRDRRFLGMSPEQRAMVHRLSYAVPPEHRPSYFRLVGDRVRYRFDDITDPEVLHAARQAVLFSGAAR